VSGRVARLTLICGVSVAMTMSVQAVLPAMPLLQGVFGISDAAAGWFTLAFTLPGLLLSIPLALVAARVPRRSAIAVLVVLYALLGLAQALADSYGVMLVLRVAQGTVFAAAMPLTLVIIGESFARSEQIDVLARRATWVTFGELAFPILGAVLATIAWQAPFVAQLAILPLALLALVVLDDRRSAALPDRTAGHIAALISRRERGWLIMGIGFARFVFKFAFIIYVPLLVVANSHASVAQAGVIVAIAAGTTAVVAAAVPRVLRHVRASWLLTFGAAAIAAALASLVLSSDPYVSAAIAVLFGIGDGILVVLSDSYVLYAWSADERPRVSAASQSARNLGKVVAPLVMSVIVAASSLDAGFLVLAVLALLLGLAFTRLHSLDAGLAMSRAKLLDVAG
jgi:ACDE family multidrug resistance protein